MMDLLQGFVQSDASAVARLRLLLDSIGVQEVTYRNLFLATRIFS
jgi:hypothetical protein